MGDVKINNSNPRRKTPIPYYLLDKLRPALRILIILLLLTTLIVITDTIGVTFNPTITIDAAKKTGDISPYLYGYSSDSDFAYNTNLVNAVNEYGAESFRIFDSYEPGTRMLVKVVGGKYSVLAFDDAIYNPGEYYNFESRLDGNNIEIYINNNKIFDVNDATFQSGGAGVLSSYNKESYFDNFNVKNLSGQTVFSDDFSGGIKSQWKNNDIYRPGDSSFWKGQHNYLYHQGKHPLAILKAGDNSWKNYTIRADFKAGDVQNFDRGFIGFTLRHQNNLNSYRFIWRANQHQPTYSGKPWSTKDFSGEVKFVKDTDTKPIAVVNMRRGSGHSAADLVRELNINQNLNITYWELGNEHYIFDDAMMTAEEYAENCVRFSRKMKQVDPNIKTGITFDVNPADPNWGPTVLRIAGHDIDFVIIHFYPFWTIGNESTTQLLASPHSFAHSFGTAYGTDIGLVERVNWLINKYAPNRSGKIETIITEFNTGSGSKGLSLAYGLTAVDLYGEMINKGINVGLFHELGVYGSHWGAFTPEFTPRPSALAVSLMTKHFGEVKLFSKVTDSPTFGISRKGGVPAMNNVPYFTSYVSKSSNSQKMYVLAINKHGLADMRTTVDIDNAKVESKANVYTLNGPSLNSTNEGSGQVKIAHSTISNASSNFEYNFPAHSATIIELNYTLAMDQDDDSGGSTPPPAPPPIGGPPEGEQITAPSQIVTAPGQGGGPHIRSWDRYGGATGINFMAFDSGFRGGVDIAYSDINGDGKKEIVAGAGPGGGPHIRAFSEQGQELLNFFPFHSDFRGGINIATGDTDGDGKDEIAVSQASNGQAWVKVYKTDANRTIVGEWNAFGEVESGADVAMGDVDNDGQDEIILGPGEGGGPLIRVFEANGEVKPIQFYAFHPDYRGGVTVAAGDVDGDGKDEIAVSQDHIGDQSWIKVYRYNTNKDIYGEWKAYGDVEIGAKVSMGDIDGDGLAEIVTGAGKGGGPQVLAFEKDGYRINTNFFAYDSAFRGGVNVAVGR